MARFAAGVVFGLVVGVVAAAAGGLHAEDESGVGVDSVDDAQAAPEVVAEPVEPQPAYGVWDRLAQCESNGRWTANTGNSYYGGLQFDLPSWRAAGGVGLPNLASRAEQIRVGINWQRMVGWGAWPVCSRVIGVR